MAVDLRFLNSASFFALYESPPFLDRVLVGGREPVSKEEVRQSNKYKAAERQ